MSHFSYRIATAMVLFIVGLMSTGCTVCGPKGCGTAICGDVVAHPCYAGQKWKGCGPCQGPKICVCTGPECHDCGPAPGCGCEPGCECEPSCVVDPGCACNEPCGCGSVCGPGHKCQLLYSVKYALRSVFGGVLGCNGCAGELYWSEWHNDPPRCCDPCDRCGNWIGPSVGYKAPYNHEFGVAH